MQVPQELKEVLDNTVVAALSHCSPLVSLRLIYFERISSCFMMLFIHLALMGREESNRLSILLEHCAATNPLVIKGLWTSLKVVRYWDLLSFRLWICSSSFWLFVYFWMINVTFLDVETDWDFIRIINSVS